MYQELQNIFNHIHNIYIRGDEAKAMEATLNEMKLWLLQNAPKEDRWQWTPEAIISNLEYYYFQVQKYSQLSSPSDRRREFPMLKASIEMQLKEIERFLA
jgi:hypothetical protein